MRIYVAAKTHDFEKARTLMSAIREAGHEITFDWTYQVEDVGPSHENESAQDPAFLAQCADRDMYGVRRAHRLVAIGHPRVCGTLVEVGMALRQGIPVDLIGEFPPSVFWELEQITKYPDEKAFLAELIRPWSMED